MPRRLFRRATAGAARLPVVRLVDAARQQCRQARRAVVLAQPLRQRPGVGLLAGCQQQRVEDGHELDGNGFLGVLYVVALCPRLQLALAVSPCRLVRLDAEQAAVGDGQQGGERAGEVGGRSIGSVRLRWRLPRLRRRLFRLGRRQYEIFPYRNPEMVALVIVAGRCCVVPAGVEVVFREHDSAGGGILEKHLPQRHADHDCPVSRRDPVGVGVQPLNQHDDRAPRGGERPQIVNGHAAARCGHQPGVLEPVGHRLGVGAVGCRRAQRCDVVRLATAAHAEILRDDLHARGAAVVGQRLEQLRHVQQFLVGEYGTAACNTSRCCRIHHPFQRHHRSLDQRRVAALDRVEVQLLTPLVDRSQPVGDLAGQTARLGGAVAAEQRAQVEASPPPPLVDAAEELHVRLNLQTPAPRGKAVLHALN